MPRSLAAPLLWSLFLLSGAVHAQPVPEKRAIFEADTDFFGGDLRAIFDTTRDLCLAACEGEAQCSAMTYNTRAASCFLKTDVQRREAYEGAFSAVMVPTDPDVLARAGDRAAELDFITAADLAGARTQAREIGLTQPPRALDAQTLLNQMAAAGSGRRGKDLAAQVVALTDLPEHWLQLSNRAAGIATDDVAERRALRQEAYLAVINAYLRVGEVPLRVGILEQLARTLEARNQGRAAIRALRLAVSFQPREDLQAALDRLIGLYGFRVVETRAESDAATPRVCVQFSERLLEGAVSYADYVTLPDGDFGVTADGRQLCIDGVTHGSRLAFALRAGLPAAGGETLHRTVEQTIYVRDRSPAVRFVGRAYVLPKSERAAIPVVSVNAETVAISIHRIPDAGLRAALADGLVGSPLTGFAERRLDAELGEPIWSGTADVGGPLNADVTTALPVGEAVTTFAPGVYAMTARLPGQEDFRPAATQWFIVTDLGLATAEGADGLHVFVRGLGDAAPQADTTVRLVARNNAPLGTTTTDARGYAVFPAGMIRGTGGNAPALVTVTDAAGDYAFVEVGDAGLDLSDRGVDGRNAPPPIDVFLATERGAYRPGESLHATILVRDPRSQAIADLPLTVIARRPDGVEFSREVLADAGAGGRTYRLDLPGTVQRGTWSLRIHADPDAAPLTEQAFLVEDFVPERIDFDLSLPNQPLRLGEDTQLTIDARYLYGAPGAGLSVEGELRTVAAPGLDEHPGYRFGPHDSPFSGGFAGVDRTTTGADGSAVLTIAPPVPEVVDRPLRLVATLRLADSSGRPVERMLERPIAPDVPMIGIRPLFDTAVPENSDAGFEVIALGRDGARMDKPGSTWTLYRVQTDYQWYEVNGRWNYEPFTTRERVATGTVDLTAAGPARISAPVSWGRYVLELGGEAGGYAFSSIGFSAGWYPADAGSDTPDRLEVSLDRDRYRIGDTAQLRLDPRSPGQILVTVISDRLIDMQTVTADAAGPLTVDLPVTDDWGPGAYVVATHIRPLDVAAGRNPSRSIGLGWVGVDPGDRLIRASFVSPAEAAPRQTLTARLKVADPVPGRTVHATISAVDIGILNLTGHAPPDPAGHYLGQRKLGMELRDVYGRLIDGLQGTRGRLRSGGDGGGMGTQGPPPTEDLVAFFSGPLTVGADGTVEASFPVPDFNGTIRLDAIVWTWAGVGAASQEVLVRDPVVVTANMPRFLAPGDRSRLNVELAHTAGPAGPVEVSVTGSPDLNLPVAAQTVSLTEGGRASLDLPLTAGLVGDHAMTIRTRTPGGETLTKTLTLGIRANDPGVARQTRITLEPGTGRLVLDQNLLAGLAPGSEKVTLATGPLARLDVPGLLTALDAYPYGCTEQTVSRALPLLYFAEMAGDLDLLGQDTLNRRMGDAIARVLSNQTGSGGFGLWSPGGGDLWLEAYVTDFLSRARAEGHAVPDQAFAAALDNLANRVNGAPDFESGGEGIAYALMILAREGRAAAGDLRYYADARSEAFATPLALAQLGTALAAYGDPLRADAMFRRAVDRLGAAAGDGWRADYGSDLRDRAAILTLAAESGSRTVPQEALASDVANGLRDRNHTSTQEKLWPLLAARALGGGAAPQGVRLGGAPLAGPGAQGIDTAALGGGLLLENTGSAPLPVIVTVTGTPTEPEPAQGNGYRISRTLYTPDGNPADPTQIARNDRLVVVLTVTPERPAEARLMVDDPLPAGFEIDNPNLLTSGQIGALDWLDLPEIAQHAEFRTDRFLAAVDWRGTDSFRLAYMVRAISPGSFRHPAASVEDMYRPAFRARTDTGQITIAAQ